MAFVKPCSAGLLIDNSFIYYSNSFKSTALATHSRIFDNVFIGATFGKPFFIGWNLNYLSSSDVSPSGTQKLSGLEMGPKLGLFLGKARVFNFALGIHPLVTLTHTPESGSVEKLRGTGVSAELGFTPQIAKGIWAGLKLLYRMTSIGERIDANNVTSNVSYSRTEILPTLYLSFRIGESSVQ